MTHPVQYLTDQRGKKTAVLVPLADYRRMIEDLEDLAAIADRREESTVRHDRFIRELKKDGILPS